jgi:beta-N-acetylhexosaminidase
LSFAPKFLFAAALVCALVSGAPSHPRQRGSSKSKPPGPVRSWMRSMTLHDKAAQLVFVAFYGDAPHSRSREYQRTLKWVRQLRVGGLLLINRVRNGSIERAEPFATATFLNRMQRAAKIPLLVAGDFERGDSMRFVSETRFPHNMAFAATRDPALSRFEGEATARQARALGMPWILAPVADVNVNPDNPIVNVRAYSENPEEVTAHVRAFIEGAHAGPGTPVLVTVKHFPGHGDVSVDTHLQMAVLNGDAARLESVELAPFRAAIAGGVDSVMSAHIAVPALDDSATPATLSSAILTGLLREKMQFEGLISTDAMDMHAISKQWNAAQAAVKAVQAGVDVLLLPANPEQAVEGIVRAVQRGEITRQRLDDSVARVLMAKVRVGLKKKKLVDPEAAIDELDAPEDIEKVQEIADKSVTLVKNDGPALPLKNGGAPVFLMLPEARCYDQGKAFAAEVKRRAPNAPIVRLDPASTEGDFEKALETAKQADAVVVAAFVSVSAYRGSVALAGGYPKLVESLIAAGKPVVLIALGNPYLVRTYPSVQAYMTTYSTVPPSEIAAAKAVFGEIAVTGRLPITIPGIAQYGDGIQLLVAPAQ